MQVIFLKLPAQCKYVMPVCFLLIWEGKGKGIGLKSKFVTFFLRDECEGSGCVASCELSLPFVLPYLICEEIREYFSVKHEWANWAMLLSEFISGWSVGKGFWNKWQWSSEHLCRSEPCVKERLFGLILLSLPVICQGNHENGPFWNQRWQL